MSKLESWFSSGICYNLAMKRLMLMLTPSVLLAAPAAFAVKCDNVTTSINFGCTSGHGVIIDFLLAILRFMGTLIGLVVILMIIIGGIQYILAQGNPQAVAAAKGRITGAITALVLYLLMFGILHYLIPGTF